IRDRNVTGVQTCALPISDSEESSQTSAETEVSNSEIAEQTEDVTTDTQDFTQTDEQEVTVEESADNVTVERGATGNATNEVTSRSEERRVGKEWRTGCGQ